MFKALIQHLPPRVFWLANILFWLILNTIAADHTHRTRIRYGNPSVWIETWLEYLPWWGNWALIAPFIIAAVKVINKSSLTLFKQVSLQLLAGVILMIFYWGLTATEVILISNGGITFDELQYSLGRLILSPLHMDVLIYMTVAGIGLAQSYYAKSQEYAVTSQRLSNQLLKAELSALKSQLNPHFLFNTLNTISGLVRLDQKTGAVKALSELSQMFRCVLENQHQQLTSLRNEMEFIDSYLSIQKLRFENKISLQVSIDEECFDAELPFMLLHTLVENAVQHGSQLESNQNIMHLDICCENSWLNIKLINKASTRDDHGGFGIGLKNCRKRLQHIYQDRFTLTTNQIEQGYFQTRLAIPIGPHHV